MFKLEAKQIGKHLLGALKILHRDGDMLNPFDLHLSMSLSYCGYAATKSRSRSAPDRAPATIARTIRDRSAPSRRHQPEMDRVRDAHRQLVVTNGAKVGQITAILQRVCRFRHDPQRRFAACLARSRAHLSTNVDHRVM